MSSIWLLSEWVGEEVAILVYVGASSLSDSDMGFSLCFNFGNARTPFQQIK